MNIPALQRQVSAADVDIEKLAGNSKIPEAEKVKEASRQFEAILVRHILATANVMGGAGGSKSASNGIYTDLLTHRLADNISHSGGIGFSDALARELGRQLHIKDDKNTAKDAL